MAKTLRTTARIDPVLKDLVSIYEQSFRNEVAALPVDKGLLIFIVHWRNVE